MTTTSQSTPSGFCGKCVNPYCNYSGANEEFYDIKDNGGRVCPKCFVEQGTPVDIPNGHMRCARCLAVYPRKDFTEIVTSKHGDCVRQCRRCGYVNK